MMAALKRLTATLKANFDWFVSQVENHEAIVNAAIGEVQTAQAKAKVQFGQLKRDGEKMQAKLAELEKAEQSWAERAVKSHTQDEKKALECVRRHKQAKADKEALVKQIAGHAKLTEQLNRDLGLIDKRLDQLKRQRNTLKTRQSRAEALSACQVDDAGLINELDNIFERWEIRVTQFECQAQGLSQADDDFENGFTSEEEETSLKFALAELIEANNSTQNQ